MGNALAPGGLVAGACPKNKANRPPGKRIARVGRPFDSILTNAFRVPVGRASAAQGLRRRHASAIAARPTPTVCRSSRDRLRRENHLAADLAGIDLPVDIRPVLELHGLHFRRGQLAFLEGGHEFAKNLRSLREAPFQGIHADQP